jgi:FkbM family methyltransferase
MSLKTTIRRRLAAGPLGPYARVYREQRNPELRRNRADDRNLALLMAFVLRSDSNCVDVGANRGHMLEQMVKLAPKGEHYAFEALPHLAAALRDQYPGVHVEAVALSDRTKPDAEFVHAVDREAYSGLQERPYPTETRLERITVPVRALDDVLPPDYVPHLIKVDTEGGEHDVLTGASRTIERHQPVIVFEQGPKSPASYGVTPQTMYDLVTGFGYAIFDMDGAGPYQAEDFAADVSSFRRFNFLARPY